MIRAVLLDVDGTLIDSNDAHARAWVDVGDEFGHHIEFGRVRWLIGMGGDRVLPELTGLKEESEEGRRMLDRCGEIFRERYLPRLSAFAGAHELLERLRLDGKTLVVATSASEADLEALLRQARLDHLIDDSTNSDEADESKPAPDIVQAALQKTGVPASQVVMIGDTPYDVKAAERTGVRIIGLRCGGWNDRDLKGASAIYDDPADLLDKYDRSILALG
jgi:HAD superfamily hydrolase (TIGR01509 family)